MKRSTKLLLGAALLAPMSAMAAGMGGEPMGSVALYAVDTKLDVPGGPYNESGTGLGVKGWVAFGVPFAHFEYQEATTGDSATPPFGEVKAKQFRLGGGAALPVSKQVLVLGKLEYIDQRYPNTAGFDFDLSGFGIHAGAIFMPMPALHVGGTLGYLSLGGGDTSSGSQGDTKGLELNLGGGYNFTKAWGAFLDLRQFNGRFDQTAASSRDWKVTDIRLGATYSFGGKM